MASGFVNEFNPPRTQEPKRRIPAALMDFEKNKSKTRNRARGNEAPEDFSNFESVMSRKEVSGTYDGRTGKASPPIEAFIGTEDALYTLNTENDIQLVTDQ